MHRWKLLEILLRRPSVQTTCSGQCRCTVVCTLVRLGKGEQRCGRLGTKVAVSKEKTFVCFFKSHAQCFSSQVLHTRDPEALRDTAEKGPLERRPVGKAFLSAHLVCAQESRGGEPRVCEGNGGLRAVGSSAATLEGGAAWGTERFIVCYLISEDSYVKYFLKFKVFPTSNRNMKTLQTLQSNLMRLVFNC